VAKKSVDKISIGGRKYALRRRTPRGVAEAEVIGIGFVPRPDDAPGDEHRDRPLLVPLVRDGEVVGREPLEAARDRHVASRAELPAAAQQMSKGDPVIPTLFEGDADSRGSALGSGA
jgi:nicotinate phosphoribosyltransferase